MLTPLVWLYQGPLGIAFVATATVVFPLLRRLGVWQPNELDFSTDMRDKVVVVTGCNTGGCSLGCWVHPFTRSSSLSPSSEPALLLNARHSNDYGNPIAQFQPKIESQGIGFPTALKIAQMGGTVVMACRSPQRAADAKARLETELFSSDPASFPHAKAGKLVSLTLDLSSFASVKQFAAAYKCVRACRAISFQNNNPCLDWHSGHRHPLLLLLPTRHTTTTSHD